MSKPIEVALKKIPNRFDLTTTLSRRWENITAGAPPLVDVKPGMSGIEIVLEEVIEERVRLDPEKREIVVDIPPQEETNDEALFSGAISAEDGTY